MGRNAKPISIHMAEGNPNRLTKAEIEHRKNTEIKIGESKLKCPEFVKNDAVAFKKWKEVTKIYKDVDFVSSGDTGLLARYCMTFSEYENMLRVRKHLNTVEVKWDDYEQFLPLDLRDGINRLLKIDPLLQIETAINKKMDMLIKMEDRLFLNPLAKVKNVPQKPKEEKPKNKFAKFAGGEGG